MITTFYPPYNFGGDGIFVQQLSNELAGRGHQVDVIHCVDSYQLVSGDREPKSYELHPGIRIHGLKSKLGLLSPLLTHQTGFPFLKSKKLQKILKQDFDVIHYHNVSLVGGPKLLGLGRGIKLFTMHEYWLTCPNSLLYKYDNTVCTKKQCVACQLVHKHPPQWWRYSRLMQNECAHIDTFIAPSRYLQTHHRKAGITQPILHLPNFVPASGPGPGAEQQSVGDTDEKGCFLFVGRLERLKGAHTLIDPFKRYREATLLLAGDGTQEEDLRHAVRDLDNIRFLGRQNHLQLQSLYRGAVAVIVPSLWVENHPLVILEAFRAKTPIIARNIGALKEIVEESKGGILYDTEDQLVAAITRLREDPALREELGENGYATYLQKFTTDVHVEQYLDLINRLKKRP